MPHDLEAMARSLGRAESFVADQTIVREGELADRWYLLAEGMAAVERVNLIGEVVQLAVLGPGESFGEAALFEATPRQATVRALTPVRAYSLNQAALEESAEWSALLRARLDVLGVDTALKRASPFARLPNDAIWSLARQFEPTRVDAHATVVREGEPAESFYLVRSGRLEVVRGQRRIAVLRTGDSFGEVGLLTNAQRNATIRALEPTELLRLPAADFQATVEQHRTLSDFFREVTTIRYRGAPGQSLLVPDPLATVMPLLGARRRKRYWLVLLLGTLAFALLTTLAELGAGRAAVFPLLAVGSLLGPIVFVLYLAESNLLSERPWELAATGVLGALLGLPLAIVVQREVGLLPGDLVPALLIAIVEETAKLLGVLWVVGRPGLRFRMDGVIYGAAAGMGFAALETTLYGVARVDTVGALLSAVWLRALLSPFTHGCWTAIVCAAVWRQRVVGSRGVLAIVSAFATAVCLHGLWNWRPLPGPLALLWIVLLGAASVLVLRSIVQRAAHEEARSVFALAPEADYSRPANALSCSGCGRPAPNGARYCPRCGLALGQVCGLTDR